MFLSFSGGKDSLTVLHLCEPYHDRLALLWVNTGLSGGRMTAFVRSFGDRFDLIEVAPERPVPEQWAEHGIPSVVLPIDHVEGVDFRSPRLQPWLSCCGANRVRPLHAFLEAQAGPCVVLNGQRRQEIRAGPLPASQGRSLPPWRYRYRSGIGPMPTYSPSLFPGWRHIEETFFDLIRDALFVHKQAHALWVRKGRR